MKKADVYKQNGEKARTIELPERIFGAPWNPDLVHQVANVFAGNKRVGTAHTKGRGEVSGGGKKPWRQKGTGRARHGSSRSPIWRGGGVTHGPRAEKNYRRSVNKKMRVAALWSAISKKTDDKELFFLDSFTVASPKTKEAERALSLIGKQAGADFSPKEAKSVLVTFFEDDTTGRKSFRNINNVTLESIRNLNVLDLLNNRYIIITRPDDSIAFLETKESSKSSADEAKTGRKK
ncbi:50S ribosomal protein L4 [bacterium]|nr:50S ribosomal protein L4 [bacterium]MCI0566189.1 50S ribosomal protein L4 [bacterium]MCI0680048.1 50S ribosomal protein L4 [bacterium]